MGRAPLVRRATGRTHGPGRRACLQGRAVAARRLAPDGHGGVAAVRDHGDGQAVPAAITAEVMPRGNAWGKA